jgi:two-component system response regulator AlgR
MKILIVDDEHLARERIVDLLNELGTDYSCYEAVNGMEALKIAEQEKPEIVLMDIRMPGMDGLESALHMSKLEPAPAVVFTTAYEEHAIAAFDANAVDYLLKPVRSDRLAKALDKADTISRARINQIKQQQGDPRRTHLSASTHGKIELIPVKDVSCFKADQKYVTVYWQGKETLIDDPLKSLEDEFGNLFIRVHRNALVATGYITGLEKTSDGNYLIKLQGLEEGLGVSRRHISKIKKTLKNL